LRLPAVRDPVGGASAACPAALAALSQGALAGSALAPSTAGPEFIAVGSLVAP
jgi:hypothetical protein